ncbi:MAG: cobalt transporter CbiM [Lachnospiraceae bacterium]|jgi:cobalt/nickel transport system permease protein|nr:cobalt transporter CbiM [Lachnospiraceae bacterium]MCH4030193.1 cobalt transporter CbiM [Lachnospiraceae bacterium]MCH4069405.1 cobalt transporter CbiM [Lachnospiraceae bacterium]MCH4107659.1 cobalt transporter CbiM [Lachnospiraceae bacterium]MCI1301490.1 cobalt transporter CbiM [Lachnospiraceae bacterium]
MHIPDNYLSPQTCAVMAAVMVPAWVISVKKVREELPKEKIPMLGVGAAFSFLGMMFNVPLPGGTTGHAVGGTLISMLLGPYAACISVSVALAIQALLFGDGGILAFGANCFNMAFVLPFVGYAVAGLIRKRIQGSKGEMIGAAIGSYVGINAAAFCAAVEFGIQPYLFHDAAGNALYCPYGLNISIPAMMIGHLTIFGLAEVIFTTAVYAFVRRVSPAMIRTEEGGKTSVGLKVLIAVLIAATPLGLLAAGTAWGEWGADEIAETGIGYTPAGMEKGFSFEAILPDYSAAGVPEVAGYILSAVIGVALLIIIFKLLSLIPQKKKAGA